MGKLIIFMAVILAAVFIAGCATPPDDNNGDNGDNGDNGTVFDVAMMDDSLATEEGVASIINANNQFALEFYKEINEDGENVFFSPYSISSAFSMAYEGAGGNTASEIQSVFHFTEDDTIRRSSFARIYNTLNKKDKSYILATANAFWGQEDYPFVEEYKNIIDTYYGGEIRNVDFVGETEETRLLINDWVEEQTYDKIKDLIPPGMLNPLSRLVLTNTIYFKGNWDLQFDEDLTYEEDFEISPGNTEKVQMMKILNVKDEEHDKTMFNYMEDEEVQIIELPYKDDELSMLVILPKENDISSLEEKLTIEQLDEWKSLMYGQDVREIYLPKFKFKTKYFLNENLQNMGMLDAFAPGVADFSGMDQLKDMYIGFVIHQTFIEVNEQGTEAAAATAIGFVGTSMPPEPKIFKADHPFIFMIQEHETGNILFMGKMVNPNAE